MKDSRREGHTLPTGEALSTYVEDAGRGHMQLCVHSTCARVAYKQDCEAACSAHLRAAVAANAEAFMRDLVPVIADIRSGGRTSLRDIATELTARGIQTRRRGVWQVSNVKGLLARIDGALPCA